MQFNKLNKMVSSEKLKEIIKGCLQNKELDMKQLYNISYGKLMNIPVRYTSSLEDAKWYFNMGMLRVYDSLKKFDLERPYFPWAGTIILRSCIDQLRSPHSLNRNKNIVDIEMSTINMPEINEILNNYEMEDIIHQLRILSPKQRIVFSLYVIDDYSHKQIQEMTGININTSKWLLARSKEILKSNLSQTSLKRNHNAV